MAHSHILLAKEPNGIAQHMHFKVTATDLAMLGHTLGRRACSRMPTFVTHPPMRRCGTLKFWQYHIWNKCETRN